MQKRTVTSNYYCEHLVLTRKTNEEIDEFMISKHPEGKGLMDYLQQQAIHDENNGLAKTYLVRDRITDELAGYFTLRAGGVKLEYIHHGEYGMYPGIELAYFAVNEKYIDKYPDYKGIGLLIFNDFIIPIAEEISEKIGVRGIFGYAVNDTTLLEHYINNYGFKRLDVESETMIHNSFRPATDDGCTFIYLDI